MKIGLKQTSPQVASSTLNFSPLQTTNVNFKAKLILKLWIPFLINTLLASKKNSELMYVFFTDYCLCPPPYTASSSLPSEWLTSSTKVRASLEIKIKTYSSSACVCL